MFSSLIELAKNPDVWRAGGQMLSAHSQAGAQNRGAQVSAAVAEEELRQRAAQQFFNQMLQRAEEGRRSGDHAVANIQRADYLSGARPRRVAAPNVSRFDVCAMSTLIRRNGSAF